MGGLRVVYEYANRLVARGHSVNLVHPRQLKYLPKETVNARGYLRQLRNRFYNRLWKPQIDWHPIDRRVNVLYAKDTGAQSLPDADAIFATAWQVVESVLRCDQSKGIKFNFIQGYSELLGPIDAVEATWRAPLHRIVISKWLMEKGQQLGCEPLEYIPNAIDHEQYRLKRTIEDRRRRVAMLFSTSPIKGSKDGIRALSLAREKLPDLQVVFFGTSRAPSWLPKWAEYHRNPPQEFIIDEIYNRSSIFLSPSWSEGFALPPAEAAACGCAIVATDSGGVRDFLQDEVTGLLSEPKNAAALGANLIRLLKNETLRVRLAKTANSFIKNLDWNRSTDQLEAFILNAMKTSAKTVQARSAEIAVR